MSDIKTCRVCGSHFVADRPDALLCQQCRLWAPILQFVKWYSQEIKRRI